MATDNNRILQIMAQLRANGASDEQIQQWAAQNGINLNVPTIIPAATGGAKGMFAGLRNRFGPGKSLFNGRLDLSGIKNLGSNIRSTQLWNGGPTLGTAGGVALGAHHGIKALQGLYNNTKAEEDLSSLKKDINASIATNPMYDMYLNSSDEKTLRQMKNGTLSNNWAEAAEGAAKGIPQAALSALLGALVTGNPIGAIVGGAGSLINSGISGYGNATNEDNAKLQGLYQKLSQAEDDYNSMKRPRNLRGAGLSRRYYNDLY